MSLLYFKSQNLENASKLTQKTKLLAEISECPSHASDAQQNQVYREELKGLVVRSQYLKHKIELEKQIIYYIQKELEIRNNNSQFTKLEDHSDNPNSQYEVDDDLEVRNQLKDSQSSDQNLFSSQSSNSEFTSQQTVDCEKYSSKFSAENLNLSSRGDNKIGGNNKNVQNSIIHPNLHHLLKDSSQNIEFKSSYYRTNKLIYSIMGFWIIALPNRTMKFEFFPASHNCFSVCVQEVKAKISASRLCIDNNLPNFVGLDKINHDYLNSDLQKWTKSVMEHLIEGFSRIEQFCRIINKFQNNKFKIEYYDKENLCRFQWKIGDDSYLLIFEEIAFESCYSFSKGQKSIKLNKRDWAKSLIL